MPSPAFSKKLVHWIGYAEGISFLLLLGVAMPLKYLAELPQAVKWTGWAHGILFIAYCLVILIAWLERQLGFRQAVLAFVSGLLPFGPFIFHRKIMA